MCDGRAHPLHFHLTAGQAHDSTGVVALLIGVDEVFVDCHGKRVPWPEKISGDKGYRANWIDEYLLKLGVQPVIPSRDSEDRAARGIEFDREAYRRRSVVEQLIGWLKESRRIFSRFEKTAKNFAGMVKWSFIHRYLRLMCE